MGQFDTSLRTLPVATGNSGFNLPPRGTTKAAFLSQLIAERHHMAPQRVKRQASVAEVLRTYDAAGRMAVRRLPPGYRKSIEA